jgi:hypothetical protein
VARSTAAASGEVHVLPQRLQRIAKLVQLRFALPVGNKLFFIIEFGSG